MRLNYIIPNDIEARLSSYCAATCRTASSVVRQLILEYVEGDRDLPPRLTEKGAGRRTSFALKPRVMGAFEERISAEGHTSKGAVIAHLLRQFLSRLKESKDEERVTVPVPVPVGLYSDLARYSAERGLLLPDLLVDAARDLLGRVALQKEA